MALMIHSRLLRAAIFTLVMALGFLAAPSLLAEEVPNEYELKPVMLFNLARFVEWPAKAFAETNSPIVIGVLGHNPFGDALERAVRGEKVNGRSLVIEHYDNVRALDACHVLFICSSEKPKLAQVLSKLKGQPILTVSEIDGFSKLPGGMVRFYVNDQKKIRLRLNLQSARTEGLGVSSKLIQVAELDAASLLWPPVLRMGGLEMASSSAPSPFPPLAR